MSDTKRPTLSLILPVFNEEEMIPELEKRLKAFVDDLGVPTEVLFVNDGSKDRSLEMLKGLVERDPRFKVLSFSRNFGHQIAITAGVDRAIGEAVVVMDADLQDPPEVVKDKRDMVRNAIGSLALVYKQDFPRSQMALVLTILDKNATATTLRAIAKPLEAFDITNADKPSDAESQIENRVRTAAKRILELAVKLDPPKPETPKDPFTLYEILVSPDGNTTLKKISQ